MRDKRTLLIISLVMIFCIAALIWVKNERRQQCDKDNNNIEQLLNIAEANQQLIRGMLDVAIAQSDDPDPQEIEEFNDALEPVFQKYRDAVNEIQLQEC